jgi:hypothetical protein
MPQTDLSVEQPRRKTRALRKPDWRVKVARLFFWLVVTSALFFIFLLLLITIGIRMCCNITTILIL